MKMLKLLLASALTGFSFMPPAWGQDRPPEAQPAPLPAEVIKRLIVEQPTPKNPALRLPNFSPDGQFLATAGDDYLIHIWDLPSGKELTPLRGHGDWISHLVFLPDGKTLASSGGKTIRLWEVPTGKEIFVLNGPYWNFACSPDGRILAMFDGKSISMLDLSTKKDVAKIKSPDDGVFSLVFSPDGKVLAAGGSQGVVHLWDVAQGNEILQFKAAEKRFLAIAWSPDGGRIATATYGKNAYGVWDAATGKELFRINEGGS